MGEEASSRDDALGRTSVGLTTPPDLQAATDDLSEQENGLQLVQREMSTATLCGRPSGIRINRAGGSRSPRTGRSDPSQPRQPSKVQELVEMYDDISMSANLSCVVALRRARGAG